MPLEIPSGNVHTGRLAFSQEAPATTASATSGFRGKRVNTLLHQRQVNTHQVTQRRLLHAVRPVAARPLRRPVLSPREIEVLLAWLRCDPKNAVAAELYLSMGTINTHLARVRSKYAAVDRPAPTKASLVARAIQDGLISLDEL